MKTYDVLIRFRTEKERKAFKDKCYKNDLTYREGINEWVKSYPHKTIAS
jgi:hypothetical protein